MVVYGVYVYGLANPKCVTGSKTTLHQQKTQHTITHIHISHIITHTHTHVRRNRSVLRSRLALKYQKNIAQHDAASLDDQHSNW